MVVTVSVSERRKSGLDILPKRLFPFEIKGRVVDCKNFASGNHAGGDLEIMGGF